MGRKLTDEKFVCDRCNEKKAENNNEYTYQVSRSENIGIKGKRRFYRKWVSGTLCKSCYAYLKSEDYVKELHTIYPVFIPSDYQGGYNFPYWIWADSISNTKGLDPTTSVPMKGSSWYQLINALIQTHGLSLEEEGNKRRFKLLFSSHPFPDHQVTLQFANAGREKNYYQLSKPNSMIVSAFDTYGGGQLEHEVFRLSHHTAIFWFNCNPKYIYLKSELLEEEGKK